MAYKINDDCSACGLCEPECPTNSISEGEDIYVVDPETCVECEGYFDTAQCAEVCPVEACVPDPDNPKE